MYIYILQRGVQWKQGVVICMVSYTILPYNTAPFHCTPLRLHLPLMNTQYIIVNYTEAVVLKPSPLASLTRPPATRHGEPLQKHIDN